MKVSTAHNVKRKTAIIGWITIFTQAALPLSFAYTPLVNAATFQDSSATKWYQSGNSSQQNIPLFGQSDDTLAGSGAALSQRDSAGAAAGMARSAATGAVNNSVEEWLGQFGTARVQLNLDGDFKAEGSEADLLIPVYENKSTILFTQLGFRHIDSRNTGNVGVGARHFVGDWMLGTNIFFDNDFTGENRRMGVGVEAWRDYLKLSANSYIRLSDWHQSRDFTDYDERPANGYDVRAQGWLPAFPQLGAKVMYEQYQGDEVALFGKDNRQQDPWAFTGGVTYTPVPLVTVGAQHRAGKDGQNDSQLLLEMNYRLGEDWSKQLDPGLVGASRTLNGTRYDLVERNNSIVLDYRKQETVTLVLPEKISGKGRTTVPVSFTVKSQSPLQRIDWDAASLVAAGGSLTQVSNSQLSVELPAYQTAGSNIYRFAGVAYDTEGNSGSAMAELHVEVGDVNASSTKVKADPAKILADGKSISTVSIELTDADGNTIPGMEKSLTATMVETLAANQPVSVNAVQAATLGPISEASPGVYQAVVTSGTQAGSIVVSPKFNDTALQEFTIEEAADAESGHIESGAILSVVDNSIANNTAINQVKAIVTDASGNPLANTAVTFALSGSATVAPGSSLSATTDAQGQVTVSFVNKIAETVTVTATLGNGNTGSVDTQFLADSSTANLNNGDVTVDKVAVVANNTDVATYSTVVKDANGNTVPDFTVNWATDKGTLSGATSNTDANGIATITLKHNVTEAAQVTAQAGSSNINAPVVHFTADNASATIGSGDLTVDKTSVVADDVDVATFSAVVKDASGNVVPNIAVNWTTNKGTLTAASSITDINGLAIITLKDALVGQAQVVAQTGASAGVNAPVVDFTANPATATINNGDIAVDKAELVADDIDMATYRATVKDAHGNVVSGVTVNWNTNKGSLSGSTSTTDANGVATITLKDTLVGQAQVTAKAGTSGNINAPVVNFVANASSATIGSGDLTVDKTTVLADNADVATYSAVVKDGHGNVVPNINVNWTTDKGTLSGSSSTTDNNGVATITLRDILVGPAQVGAQTGTSSAVNAPSVNFIADSGSAGIASGDLTVDKVSVVANDTDIATYTALVKDANGNVVPNLPVSWATDLGTLSAGTSTTDSNGLATITLKGTVAGNAQVTASANGHTATNAPMVAFIADTGSASINSSDLTVDKTTIVANETEFATFSAIVKDTNGNLIPNIQVEWVTDLGALSGSTSITDDNGLATIMLKGTVAGNAQVQAKVGTSANVNAPLVNLTPDSASATIGSGDLSVDKTTVVANDVDMATYTVTVKDAGGNVVPNMTVTWGADIGDLSASSTVTDSNGRATTTLKGTVVGEAQVTASVNGTAPVNANKVNLIADSTTATIGNGDLNVDKTTFVANNTEVATYTALVKDAYGNMAPNVTINWTTDHGTLSGNPSTTGVNGLATITLRGTLVGVAQVTAAVISNTPVNAQPVNLIADVSTATLSSGNIQTDKTALFANDTEVVTYTATVKDAYNNPVSGQAIVWAGNPASTTLGASTPTNNAGQTQVTLKGTREQTAVINATLNGGAAVNAPTVMFNMPEIEISGDQPITAQNITNALANTEAVFVNLYNAHWAPTITFPAASGLSGKSVKIHNNATLNSAITVNGTTFNAVIGTTYIYTSNGSTWVLG